ncbi:DUF4433 domain-containing protein [Moraxella sp. ZY210820]|uniref:type II toxin-antitoxin system toxin DNA ADP-ribosyl transferase DarT n=1 Tax=unclassified Moraxella TaxID=2685852 RepID=UPI002731AF4A|nr:DUF4433 domain-containing protein [Moraxella sp. ZY210820]WLF84569.1 DUF4433 domain-containing protein [Moraxella sp. ZY210820]
MIPSNSKIYHIVHKDRLSAIIQDGCLFSDALIRQRANNFPVIGLDKIKDRRLDELKLTSYPDLFVGQCVPFYFCPRSIMLYMINQRNSQLTYQGGQENIIHLQADLRQVIDWANSNNIRWAFTDSNAGSYHFNDYNQINEFHNINWTAVNTQHWSAPEIKAGKQAEFLIEQQFPICLIEKIGVHSQTVFNEVSQTIQSLGYQTNLEICENWYYEVSL